MHCLGNLLITLNPAPTVVHAHASVGSVLLPPEATADLITRDTTSSSSLLGRASTMTMNNDASKGP
eukprot:1658516-Pleurochrysis_carterae.AAC.2